MSRSLLSALASVVLLAIPTFAQSTAITYQGELKQGTSVANGSYDLRFKLFDVAVGGVQVGTTVCSNNVQVADGKFTTSIDFGQSFISSAPRFVEIEVRADTGLDCASGAGFVVLTPRQNITAAPLAIHAKSAFSLAAADGSPSNAVIVDNNGLVGIGTTTPTHTLHIASTGPTLALQDTDSSGAAGGQQVGYLSYRDNTNTERGWIGYGSPGDPDLTLLNARAGGDIILNSFSGNVGIGTAAPASKLEVHGDIRMGTSGTEFATRGEENLRIVRGTVDTDGTIIRGSGFTAQRLDVGKYRVTFTSPFSSTPAITATSTRHGGDLQVGYVAMDDFALPTPTQATLLIRVLPANDYRDSRFDFIAVGPR